MLRTKSYSRLFIIRARANTIFRSECTIYLIYMHYLFHEYAWQVITVSECTWFLFVSDNC